MNDLETVAAMEPGQNLDDRVEAIFDARVDTMRQNLDRMFGWLSLGLWAFAIVLALWISPSTWAGKTADVHLHLQLAIVLGGLLSALPLTLSRVKPGAPLTRHAIGLTMALWAALLIHLTGGRIETHFFVFGSLAWLSFYLDWRVLLTATVAVAADHLLRGLLYPESVYGIANPEWWRFLEHAFWVVFEDIILVWACFSGLRTIRDGAEREARMAELSEINENKSAALELMLAELEQNEPAPTV